MANEAWIFTKSGLRMEVRGVPAEGGDETTIHLQLDRVGAQFLARRLLQLAGNDREVPDPSMGEHVFCKSIPAYANSAYESKNPGSQKLVKPRTPVRIHVPKE